MRRPMFGRRTTATPPPAPPQSERADSGHAAVLARLRATDAGDPLARPQLAGRILFDFTYRMIQNERGARIEDLLAILASTGGFACIHAALTTLAEQGKTTQEAGIVTARGQDGNDYLFGDLPNRALIESELALLSLALGAAQACGGQISIEMVHDAMRHVAGSVGGAEFGVPRLPEQHRPGDLPINYVRHIWPKIAEALDLYEVPVEQRPTAIGFALQQAIDLGKDTLDPTIAARIAVECAVPMAKLDPARFGWRV
jgi:hypothetical protein